MSRGIRIEHNGEEHTLTEWAKIVGISYGKMRERYQKGYRGEKLLTKGKTLNCKICGKEFFTEVYTRKCCTAECSKENAKINGKLYAEKQKTMKPKKKEKKLTIDDMQAARRGTGMSYGQYEAMMYLKERGGRAWLPKNT